MQVLPGLHCLICHKNREKTDHGCVGSGTICTPNCDKLLKNMSDPTTWSTSPETP